MSPSILLQIRNLGASQCLDTLGKNDVGGEPGMYMCHGQGNNQVLHIILGLCFERSLICGYVRNLTNCKRELEKNEALPGVKPATSVIPVELSNQVSYEVTSATVGHF